jgi:hypothetical protein
MAIRVCSIQFIKVSTLCCFVDSLGIMKLVKRCDCCNNQRDGLLCSRRGQRLRTIYDLAVDALRNGLAEGAQWTASRFGGSEALASQAVGIVRAAFALGMKKIEHLDQIPFLFARLDQSGVRDRIIAQFDSVSISQHSSLSVWLCRPGSENRNLLMQIRPDGSGVPDAIKILTDKLSYCNLDDTRNETPHAEAKRKFETSPRPCCCSERVWVDVFWWSLCS